LVGSIAFTIICLVCNFSFILFPIIELFALRLEYTFLLKFFYYFKNIFQIKKFDVLLAVGPNLTIGPQTQRTPDEVNSLARNFPGELTAQELITLDNNCFHLHQDYFDG